MHDSETVRKLKELVEGQTGVSSKNMKLKGWSNNNKAMFISDGSVLADLGLPLENHLYVVNMLTIADELEKAAANVPGAAFAIGSTATTSSLNNDEASFDLYIKLVHSGDLKFHRFGST